MIKVVDHFFIVANYGWKYQSIVSFILVLITCLKLQYEIEHSVNP